MGLGKLVTFIAAHTQTDTNLTQAINLANDLMKKVDEKFLQLAFKQVQAWIGNDQFKDFFVVLMIISLPIGSKANMRNS